MIQKFFVCAEVVGFGASTAVKQSGKRINKLRKNVALVLRKNV